MQQNQDHFRRTSDDVIAAIKQRVTSYCWNDDIVNKISALRAIEHLARVAIAELEDIQLNKEKK